MKSMHALLLCAATALISPVSSAAQVSTLQDLFDGDSLDLGEFIVDNWNLETNVSDVSIDFGSIDVSISSAPKHDYFIDYVFGAGLVTGATEQILFQFSYDMYVSGGISFAGLALTGVDVGAAGLIAVDQSVFAVPDNTLACTLSTEVDAQFGINRPSDATLCFPGKRVHVEKLILVQNGASLGDLHQHWVPEPATLALLSAGLLGAFGAARRRSRG